MSERVEVRVIASSSNWIDGAAVLQLERTAALPGMRLAYKDIDVVIRDLVDAELCDARERR